MRALQTGFGFVFAALCCLLPQTAQALVQTLHYEGEINVDGLAHTGPLELRFELSDAVVPAVWSEEWTGEQAVAVSAGRFSVDLGRLTPFPEAVFARPAIYIRVAARLPGDGEWTPLAGRHRLGITPRALWSTRANFMNVDGAVTVGNRVDVTGTLNASSANVESIQAGSAELGALAVTQRVSVSEGQVSMGTADASGHVLTFANALTGYLDIGGILRLAGNYEIWGDMHAERAPRIDFGGNVALSADAQEIRIGTPGGARGFSELRGGRAVFQANMTHEGDFFVDNEARADFRSMRIDPTGGTAQVLGSMTANQLHADANYSLRFCRLCLNFKTALNPENHVCAHMNTLQRRGLSVSPAHPIASGAVEHMEMVWLCDGALFSGAGIGAVGR